MPVKSPLGRSGGKKKPKGFAVMTKQQRAEIAKKAPAARWGKTK